MKSLARSKKGMVGGVQGTVISTIMMVIVVSMILFVYVIFGSGLMDSTDNEVADQVINDSISETDNLTSQWGTIFLLAGLLIIVAILAVVIFFLTRASKAAGGSA